MCQKDEYYTVEERKDGANLHEMKYQIYKELHITYFIIKHLYSSLENATERHEKTFDKKQLREQSVFRCRSSVTEYIHVTSNPDVEDVVIINCHRTHRSRPRHNHQQCGFHL